MRLQLHQTIEEENQIRMDDQRKNGRAVLEGVVDVILFLSKQYLPFRGHRESFEFKNQGNFLETVKLLAKYDPARNTHPSDIQLSNKSITTHHSPIV